MCFSCGNMMACVPVQMDISRQLWGTKQAEKVIWEIMWHGSQSRDSGSKVMGFISPIVRVLMSFVILDKLINLLLPHFSICKMDTIIAPTSEGGWEDSENLMNVNCLEPGMLQS